MSPIRFVVLLALGAWSGMAAAQTPPARIGNVYNGTAHQPSAGVATTERQAGVNAPPAAAQRDDDTVRQIDKQLLGKKDNLGSPPAAAGK